MSGGSMSGWLMSTVMGILAGAAGSMGLGGGSVLMLWLTLGLNMEQMEAQGVNLIFFLPTAAVALIIHAKSGLIKWKTTLWCAAFGLLGAVGGYLIATVIDGEWLGKIFGGFLILFGLKEIFAKKQSEK